MADGDREPDKRGEDELSDEELESERGGELPDREALSVLNADVAIPVDPSIAADVLSGDDASEGDSGDEPPPDDEPSTEG